MEKERVWNNEEEKNAYFLEEKKAYKVVCYLIYNYCDCCGHIICFLSCYIVK